MPNPATIPALHYPVVRDLALFDAAGPRPQFLVDGAKLKVLVAALEPGQCIPAHPETLAIYYFIEGDGMMTVNDDTFPVQAGTAVIAPPGASRGMEAGTRLVFLAAKAGE